MTMKKEWQNCPSKNDCQCGNVQWKHARHADGVHMKCCTILQQNMPGHCSSCQMKHCQWQTEHGLTTPSTDYVSFRWRVSPVNHLHWYRQSKLAVVKSTPKNTQKHSIRQTTDRPWFSRLHNIQPEDGLDPFFDLFSNSSNSTITGQFFQRSLRVRLDTLKASQRTIGYSWWELYFTVVWMAVLPHRQQCQTTAWATATAVTTERCLQRLVGLLAFNGTFSTNRLYRAVGV